ncbi:MAG: ribose-phosphate diphosphokinase [Deltaproteobacteria bacterium]|nr:ribose-phosphate diphosphokinase [Deltaproteobacteria bacterium]
MVAPFLHVFPDTRRFGRALARVTGWTSAAVRVHAFPDGETVVTVRHPSHAEAIVVRSLHDPNAKLFEVLLTADALRRAGARRLTLIAPYLPYMRQDRVFKPGEPISQRVLGGVLGAAFDRVLTVEAHLHRVARLAEVVPRARARSLSAAPVLAAWLGARRRDTVLVGPDAESAAWVRAVAQRAGMPWVVGDKQRGGDRRVRLRVPVLPPASHAVLIDDIVSSGATLAAAARGLRRRGIATVDAIAVHALITPAALARLRRAGIRHLWSCDTVPHPTNAISVAPLFVDALARRGDPAGAGQTRPARRGS